jgi:hypothetical protein
MLRYQEREHKRKKARVFRSVAFRDTGHLLSALTPFLPDFPLFKEEISYGEPWVLLEEPLPHVSPSLPTLFSLTFFHSLIIYKIPFIIRLMQISYNLPK